MLSTKSIQRLYQQPKKLQKLYAKNKFASLSSSTASSDNTMDEQHLSRDQVLEIYDWIAQLQGN